MPDDIIENRPRSIQRRVMGLIVTILGAYGLWLAAGCAIQRSVMFPRNATMEAADPGADFPALEKSWQKCDEGRVEVWFVPADDASADRPAPLVIFCHGNAELIDQQAAIAHGYHRLGCHVLLVEYRGYGRSDGSPTQKKITKDLVQAYDAAVQRPEVDSQRVVFHGRSVGTGAACSLATERTPAALILRSPFRSAAAMAARFGILRPFVLDPFDNEAALKKFDGPVLIMHGDRDGVIRPAHGRALAGTAANATLRIYEGVGHNDFPVHSARHWQDVETFLTEVGVVR